MQFGKMMSDIRQLTYKNVHDLALSLNFPFCQDDVSLYGRAAEALVNPRMQDEIRSACFVLKGHKHDAFRGARSLTKQHKTGDLGMPSVR